MQTIEKNPDEKSKIEGKKALPEVILNLRKNVTKTPVEIFYARPYVEQGLILQQSKTSSA